MNHSTFTMYGTLLIHLWCDCLGALWFQLCQTRPHHLSPKSAGSFKKSSYFLYFCLYIQYSSIKMHKWKLVPDSRLSPQFLECSNDVSQSNLQACNWYFNTSSSQNSGINQDFKISGRKNIKLLSPDHAPTRCSHNHSRTNSTADLPPCHKMVCNK